MHQTNLSPFNFCLKLNTDKIGILQCRWNDTSWISLIVHLTWNQSYLKPLFDVKANAKMWLLLSTQSFVDLIYISTKTNVYIFQFVILLCYIPTFIFIFSKLFEEKGHKQINVQRRTRKVHQFRNSFLNCFNWEQCRMVSLGKTGKVQRDEQKNSKHLDLQTNVCLSIKLYLPEITIFHDVSSNLKESINGYWFL